MEAFPLHPVVDSRRAQVVPCRPAQVVDCQRAQAGASQQAAAAGSQQALGVGYSQAAAPILTGVIGRQPRSYSPTYEAPGRATSPTCCNVPAGSDLWHHSLRDGWIAVLPLGELMAFDVCTG